MNATAWAVVAFAIWCAVVMAFLAVFAGGKKADPTEKSVTDFRQHLEALATAEQPTN